MGTTPPFSHLPPSFSIYISHSLSSLSLYLPLFHSPKYIIIYIHLSLCHPLSLSIPPILPILLSLSLSNLILLYLSLLLHHYHPPRVKCTFAWSFHDETPSFLWIWHSFDASNAKKYTVVGSPLETRDQSLVFH